MEVRSLLLSFGSGCIFNTLIRKVAGMPDVNVPNLIGYGL